MKANYIIQDSIKFKLSREKMKAVNTANMCISLELFSDPLETAMMKALLMQVHIKVQKKLMENKKNLNLILSVAEAVAFFKLHNLDYYKYDPFTFATLNPILSEIQSKLI